MHVSVWLLYICWWWSAFVPDVFECASEIWIWGTVATKTLVKITNRVANNDMPLRRTSDLFVDTLVYNR